MKNILRYIFALPAGVLASFVFINFYEILLKYILKYFLYFDFMQNIADLFFLGYSSFVLLKTTILIVPGYKKLFLHIASVFSILAICYSYFIFDQSIFTTISYTVGTVIAFIILNDNLRINKMDNDKDRVKNMMNDLLERVKDE